MKRVKIKMVNKGMRELLHSDEITASCKEQADRIAERAGEGYTADIHNAGGRNVAGVITSTAEAARDNMERNTLLKAMGGGSG